MLHNRPVSEYEPVTRSRRAGSGRAADEETGFDKSFASADQKAARDAPVLDAAELPAQPELQTSTVGAQQQQQLKRGHALSYIGLFLFTVMVYVRPYELTPSLLWLSSSAFWLAVATLVAYVPSQLAAEGTLSVRSREVNCALFLALAGLCSIPLAYNRVEAWETYLNFAKVVAIFIVAVNATRTERRLRGLLLLALAISCVISVNAISDYRAGRLDLRGGRIEGVLGGMFENPNDMALHLVTMIPVAIALFLAARGLHKKIAYTACMLLMVGATVVTFSRGGFLGLVCAVFLLAWKLGRRNRFAVVGATGCAVVLFLALAPGGYMSRLASIYNRDLDTGSISSRQDLLLRSLLVAARNPLVGIGMGNFHNVSEHEQVSHNAYTQVGAEMGLPAMLVYILLIVTPLKRLRRIERETFDGHKGNRFYYLSVGLQASLVAYMVSSFFASVAYLWYVYYLVAYAFCLARLYEAQAAEAAAPALQATAAQPEWREEVVAGGGAI